MVNCFVKVLCDINKMASLDIEEESLPDEVEGNESELNLNYNVQAIQDVQGERNIKIY